MSGVSEIIDEASLLRALWHNYAAVTPHAERVQQALLARGEPALQNDHVALRTFELPGCGLVDMARMFEALGWRRADRYVFADKHLDAAYWAPPRAGLPKIFISALRVDALPPPCAEIIRRLVAMVPPAWLAAPGLPLSGRPWQVSHAEYNLLSTHSEYAAWVAAYGFRVNHFTVAVHTLVTLGSLAELNAFLEGEGFALARAGGVIKGSPEDLLEQSSTQAEVFPVDFVDGTFAIPSCYYEFAQRYPDPRGGLFEGFVPASANRLFESTSRSPSD